MEYVQMTLDDWVQMKESLKKDLNGVAESFVRIGYKLRKIEEKKLYEKDGYKSLTDFAKAEYGLSASTVSRFIKINEKYSIDGYSEQLRPEFQGIGSSKLAEMLTLPDADCTMIRPETTRESIRDLKEFNRQQPAVTEMGLREVVEQFFRDNKEITNAVFGSDAYLNGDMEELADIVNPSGNKTYRKGMYFLMMYGPEDGLKVKKIGGTVESMGWAEFFSIAQEIFGEDAAGGRTYESHFGEPEPAKAEPKPEKADPKPQQKSQEPEEKTTPKTTQKEYPSKTREEEKTLSKTPLAPAQKSAPKPPENPPSKQEEKHNMSLKTQPDLPEAAEEDPQIPGQMEVKDFPNFMPEPEIPENAPDSAEESTYPEPQEIEGEARILEDQETAEQEAEQERKTTRLEYIQGLTEYGLACYLSKHLPEDHLKDIAWMELWLGEMVDYRGFSEKEVK